MKRFEFKLQPLLNYRQYLEKIAQLKTARAQMDIKNCEKKIMELTQIKDINIKMAEKAVTTGVKAFTFRQYQNFLASIQSSIKNEISKKSQLKKKLKENLLKLKKKSIDKKAMEIYKEKLKSEYDQAMIQEEQKELDEIVSIKTARKISNGAI